MSYNGSGTFVINTSGQPVVAGTVISSTAFNALTADLATGLSTAITKDGQTTTTARIPFAAGISSTLVTDSSSVSTGSIITAGGVGIAKALYVGTTANIAGVLSTTSPNITTSITTPSTSFDLINATATTLNLGGAATAVNVGAATGTMTVANTTLAAKAITASTTLSVTGVTTVQAGTAALPAITTTGDTNTGIFFPAADTIAFTKGGAEAMRIDSSGNLLVGTTTTSNGGKFLVAQPTAAAQSAVFQSTNATAGNNYGVLINYTVTSPNGTSNQFLSCSDSTQVRAEFRSNGGLGNYSANNVNLSDARTKTDIQDAGSYLTKICAIPVRTFKYKDQTDDLLNLGCIAQEVESVAPELVDVSGFGKTPEDGIPLKAIYQTDLQYALMKCIQEQQALITSLTARITALEAK